VRGIGYRLVTTGSGGAGEDAPGARPADG
jgi:hypothetical protein